MIPCNFVLSREKNGGLLQVPLFRWDHFNRTVQEHSSQCTGTLCSYVDVVNTLYFVSVAEFLKGRDCDSFLSLTPYPVLYPALRKCS